MQVSKCYQQDVELGRVQFDPAQALVLPRLDALQKKLVTQHHRWQSRRWRWLSRYRKPINGLYLYGGVGVGKTYLMDILYNNLSFHAKHRTHFHRFMQYVHTQLTLRQGQKDPLIKLADHIAKSKCVLFFDELYVADIGDAMLLGNLFNALFDAGITLIATSNLHPNDLYKNGLQRELFLPAIAALKQHTDIIHLQSDQDYRLRTLTQAGVYFSPLDLDAKQAIRQTFMTFADPNAMRNTSLEVLGRDIETHCHTHTMAWFDCTALCSIPRSAYDYVELAKQFHTVFVSDVPIMGDKREDDDLARNFISMVDVFYDNNIKLVMSAAASITKLYQGERLTFDFQRTQSRLIEMQSEDYLARTPHVQ